MNLIATKTFTADLVRHGSWGSHDIGKHESTMELYFHAHLNTGCIDWDIPAIQTEESIGLLFEIDEAGVRTLIDYDGVFSLPAEAVEMLKEAGVIVTEDFID